MCMYAYVYVLHNVSVIPYNTYFFTYTHNFYIYNKFCVHIFTCVYVKIVHGTNSATYYFIQSYLK